MFYYTDRIEDVLAAIGGAVLTVLAVVVAVNVVVWWSYRR